jgi:hypothetical protein
MGYSAFNHGVQRKGSSGGEHNAKMSSADSSFDQSDLLLIIIGAARPIPVDRNVVVTGHVREPSMFGDKIRFGIIAWNCADELMGRSGVATATQGNHCRRDRL